MQDRYFGDVGDFGKFGLLRALGGTHPQAPALRLGMVWYLFPNETHNDDGKHLSYLHQAAYRSCDPYLFERLTEAVGGSRCVARVPGLEIFPSRTVYFQERLDLAAAPHSQRQGLRSAWFSRALAATASSELVFCDPDNGIAADGAKLNAKDGGKFVGLDELKAFYSRGQSVVVYQHADHTAPVEVQALSRSEQLRNETTVRGLLCLRFRRGTTRLYFVLPSEAHAQTLRQRAEDFVASPWGQHFDLLPVE